MAEKIDIESALENAIFELTKVDDMRDPGAVRRLVAQALDEFLLPALAAVKANEKRIQAASRDLGRQLFDTACAINRVATAEARVLDAE
jgi:hypothetical protein